MSTSSTDWTAIILAAGQGKRMRSTLPKVLHSLAGWPMVRHVARAVADAGIDRCIAIVSPNSEAVRDAFGAGVEFVVQPQPHGTGDAVARARPIADGAHHALVLNGDAPLITAATLRQLIDQHQQHGGDVTFLTAMMADPASYGRVLRDAEGNVVDVVEAADVEGDRVGPAEINAGQYCFRGTWLWPHLEQISSAPNGERYLTSLVGIAVREGASVQAMTVADASEVLGINDRSELAQAEGCMRARINHAHMLNGVTIVDPATTYVDAGVAVGQDTVIEPNTHLRGATVIGERCTIGPDADLRDATIGDSLHIVSSVIEESTLEDHTEVGPYSHLRAGSYLSSGVHIGNFAEVKNARLGRGVRMGHHSYIGDADVGDETNIGAGTITCNFDGVAKERTIIGKRVFIGSDTMLVAPLTIGDDARTGAGSVVTKDVPSRALAVGSPARVMRNAAERRSAR